MICRLRETLQALRVLCVCHIEEQDRSARRCEHKVISAHVETDEDALVWRLACVQSNDGQARGAKEGNAPLHADTGASSQKP